jgi:hypothetical protein
MAMFDIGDKVRVSQDSTTPYRGKTGIIETYLEEAVGVMCQVRFDVADLPSVEWFPEEMLDPAD